MGVRKVSAKGVPFTDLKEKGAAVQGEGERSNRVRLGTAGPECPWTAPGGARWRVGGLGAHGPGRIWGGGGLTFVSRCCEKVGKVWEADQRRQRGSGRGRRKGAWGTGWP